MTAETVGEYIAGFPPEVQDVLEQIRRTIHEAVPGAGEKISYRIPTITLDGRYVIYFAGFTNHVSVYPVPDLDPETAAAVAPYRSGKGTVRFPLGQPVPLDLVARVATLLAQRDR